MAGNPVGNRELDERVTVLESAGPGGAATALATTGADVVISGAAPPAIGQVLTATSAVAANWQTPAVGGGLSHPQVLARTMGA